MKTTTYVGILGVALVLVAALSFLSNSQPNFTQQTQIQKFASESDLQDFLNTTSYGYGRMTESAMAGAPAPMMAKSADNSASAQGGTASAASDFSTTNVQVAGVDESDFVKNDDKYIYTISGNQVVITDAYPAESMKIVSQINLSDLNPSQLYLDGDRLVVFGSKSYNYPMPLAADTAVAQAVAPSGKMMPPIYYYQPTTFIKVYDVSDRTNPVLKRDLELNGSYYDSRMVGDYVYAILNVPANRGGPLPVFSPYQRGFPDIYYFPVPDYSYQYTNIISLDVKDDAKEMQNKVFLLGYSNNIFVSENNIYMVYQKQLDESYMFNKVLDEVTPLLPADIVSEISVIKSSDKTDYRKMGEIQLVLGEWVQNNPDEAASLQQRISDKYQQLQEQFDVERDKSIIQKISIKDGAINYEGNGEVPGTPLNQFSMDESNGYFRIATTSGTWKTTSQNNLYVLDSGMNVVGRLEGLAPGERTYSARFIGDRAYLVTFKTVDPLFVIDLSDPTNPKMLGYLKTPGYSDYLHPYDATHLIGIGKDVDESIDADKVHTPGAIYYTAIKGLKISVFDVSDVEHPVETAKYVIGDRGTDSAALYDHKAFLFSKDKNLLVLPMTVNELKPGESTDAWPQTVFSGAYVFNITANDISVRGRISHATNETEWWTNNVRRSLYMDDVLYTISSGFIKANSLADMSTLGTVSLPLPDYGFWYGGPVRAL